MANYLLAYHGGGMAATEEDRKKSMAAWGKWFQELGAAVVDAGNPTTSRGHEGRDPAEIAAAPSPRLTH